MSSVFLQRQLGYRLQQLGIEGIAGVLMLVLAVVCWFILIHGGEAELVALQHKQQALQKQAESQSRLPVTSALNREEQLRVFYKSFAATDQLPDTLQRIYKAAAKQQLALETGEYTRTLGGKERLARFRITLPVRGSFRQILGFMDAVLQADNTVALENASFKRDKVDDDAVEAKLVFVALMDTQP